MEALLQAATSPLNIIYTGLLVIVLLYWLSVIIGALDIGSFDIDFDVDADVDVDTHVDADVHGPGWIAGALHFFNFGRLPFMVILTFLVLCMWSFSILSNHYIGGNTIGFALAMFLPLLLLSLIITKVVTTPLVPVFESLNGGVESVDYIGLTCKILLPATTSQMGQAEVIVNDNPLLINVKVNDDKPIPLLKGEEAVILKQSSDERFYLIEKL